ncbi:MAG: DUF4292 domain-containing protein [Ignavibacteriae bacterium]|nr:DUF4292 domain-containing protein [Ignavibacteriota bacterium]
MNEQPTTHEEVFQRVMERNNLIHTLQSNGNISVDSPELSNSGTFRLSLKKPDSLLLEIRGPFGIHVGTLSLTKTTFQFYSALENQVVIGSPDSSSLLSILHVALPVEQILDAFTGAFPIVVDSLIRFSITDEEYLMAFQRKGKTIEYRIDAESYIITDYLVKDVEDKVLYKAEASRITAGSDVSTPSVLKISFPDDGRSISLVYKKVNINEDVDCSFTLPEQVKVIRK